jgi:hypothetical protein
MADHEKTLHERVNDGEFNSKLPYPLSRSPEAKEKQKAHREDVARLNGEFKAAALAKTGLAGHPKADKAYAMAWDLGHASGLHEVLGYLEEIAEVLL